jgi:hypothetical protein
MAIATAHVPTANASRYLQQLCRHWGHRLQVDFQTDRGTVRFPDAVATMTASESGLVVNVEADSEETLDRFKGVIVSHLDRFAFREAPLRFHWSAA